MATKVKKAVDQRLLAFLGSALDLSEDFYPFSQWAIDCGLGLNVLLRLTNYNRIGMGYGVQVKERVKKGLTIFRFPLEYAMTSVDHVLSPTYMYNN